MKRLRRKRKKVEYADKYVPVVTLGMKYTPCIYVNDRVAVCSPFSRIEGLPALEAR